MSRPRTICRTPGCSNEIKHTKAGLCGKCYSFMYYWKDRTPTQKMNRISQLEFWQKRANALLTPAKVVGLEGRRKRRA